MPASTEPLTNHQALTNRQVRLAARPSGLPRATDWSLTTEEVPEPAEGQFVVAVSHLSVDPAMRGWMNAGASYIDVRLPERPASSASTPPLSR